VLPICAARDARLLFFLADVLSRLMRTSEELLAELRTLHPQLIDLSLGRIERLLGRLGHPEARLPPVIHVAGTNGKGSVAAFLKAMLQAAGKRVHVYTSPHLVRFNERIELAGADGRAHPIAEGELADILSRAHLANAGDSITFFEITTAAAFLAFAEHPADAVILEVGLGGRLDTTNVVARPALTVITPVSLDHQDKLGATLAAIAAEKAGILKPRVQAIIARQQAEALGVIRKQAASVAAPLVVWGEDYEAFEQRGRLVYQSAERLLDLPLPALMGHHQIGNAGTAVAAALHLKGLGIGDRAIERGLIEVRWPARMQRLDNGPLSRLLSPGSELWLDGAHNPGGAEALAQTLAELEERAPKPVGLIVGMMGQKDAPAMLAHFRGLVRRLVTVPIPGAHVAAHDPVALAKVAAALGLAADAAPGVEAAIARLQRLDSGPLRIVICGSLYLAGQVLALQEGVQAQMN
jgi:dihydrofolate synthase/folylpolyglutamate synthase